MSALYLNRHIITGPEFLAWAERARTPWAPATHGRHLRIFLPGAGAMRATESGSGAAGAEIEILSWGEKPLGEARRIPLEVLVGRLRYRLRCQPTRRRGRTERDAYLVHRESAGIEPGTRAEVYRTWLNERIKGASIETVDILRAGPETMTLPGRAPFRKPVAELTGELVVADSEAFAATLIRGIGRQVSLGFGMMLVGRA